MTINELYQQISEEAFTMRRGINNTSNPTPFRERMKNILYNNLDEIENALKYAAEANDKITALEIMLDDADAEIDSLKAQQTTQAPKSTGKKGKPKDE